MVVPLEVVLMIGVVVSLVATRSTAACGEVVDGEVVVVDVVVADVVEAVLPVEEVVVAVVEVVVAVVVVLGEVVPAAVPIAEDVVVLVAGELVVEVAFAEAVAAMSAAVTIEGVAADPVGSIVPYDFVVFEVGCGLPQYPVWNADGSAPSICAEIHGAAVPLSLCRETLIIDALVALNSPGRVRSGCPVGPPALPDPLAEPECACPDCSVAFLTSPGWIAVAFLDPTAM